MFDRKSFWLAIPIVAALGMTASAEGFYAGASWLSTGAEFETAFDDFDTDDSGWKVFAGADFTTFLGVELSYRDLGDFSDSSGSNTFDAELTVYDASVRGFLPVGRAIELFAKVGYSNLATDFVASDGSSPISGDADEWELFYGFGVGIKLGESFGLRAEWEEWDVDTSLNSFSAGAYIRFGGK